VAESYPLALPNTGFASIRFVARNAVAVSTSPFTFSTQVYRHQGQGWEADISLPPMNRETAEAWVSFLLRLRGQYGTFLLSDPNGLTPRGSAASAPGTPVVYGAGQTGDYLAIDGAPQQTTYLKAGDYIQLGSGSSATLHKVLEDAVTSELGRATLNIFPGLRSAPADNATVTVSNCKGAFRLNVNETSWDVNTVSGYGISFGAVEAI